MVKRKNLKRRRRSGKAGAPKRSGTQSAAARRSSSGSLTSVRRHRQVIYLNDNELEAIKLYCSHYRVRSRSALFREAVMYTIGKVFDEGQPTLF